jgi:radical SAM protein with 4Fe4S-binding SPASM domain
MTTDQLTDLLTQLDVGGVIEIALSGGETTTRPDIVDVIRHSASLRCYFEFFTNGHVLRPRVVDALREVAAVKARGLQIHLSLDGATAEEHDWIRGPGSFRGVVNSMEILGSLQAPLVVESVLTPASASLAGIRRIVDTCKRRGVWGVSFHAASLSGRAGCRPSDFLFTLDGLARFRRDVELVAAENSDIKVEYEQYFYPGPRKPDAEVSLPPNVGPQGMYLMGIGANGDVYPCTEAIGDLTQIIGNVKRQSVLDVWQSERWTIHRGGWDLVDLKACRGCMFDGNCQMQTCRCYARRVRGDFYDAMPECYANRETLWNR